MLTLPAVYVKSNATAPSYSASNLILKSLSLKVAISSLRLMLALRISR